MTDNVQDEIRAIINERRVQRYYGNIYKLTKRKDLLSGDPLSIAVEFIVSILSNIWPKKTMQQYLLRLLEFNQVVDEVLKWRSKDNNNNILHFACQFGRIQAIDCIMKRCSEDFINELNVDHEPPMFYLKFNKANTIISMKSTLELFMRKTKYGEAVLKRMLKDDLASCSISFISACFECYADLKDVSKINSDIMVALLKYYFLDISIWRRNPMVCNQKRKLNQLLQKITLPHEACVDLLQIFHTVIYSNNTTTSWRGRYYHHIIYLHPQILSFILKNLDHTKIRFDTAFMKYNINYLTMHHWRSDELSAALVEFLVLVINSPVIYKVFHRTLDRAKIFDAPEIHLLIQSHDFYHKVTNNEFKHEKLRSAMESYIHGVVFPSDATDLHQQEFPLNDLPSDLIGVVISFLPYQQLLAFALTCNRFYRTITESRVVWQRKFQQAFPYDAKPKEFTLQSYRTRYKHKFAVGKAEEIKLESTYPFETINVYQNILSACFLENICLYDFETRQAVKFSSRRQTMYGGAKRFGDLLYVAGNVGFELHSLHDYKPVGMLEMPDKITKPFDVNDKWIMTNDYLFDVTTGKVLEVLKDSVSKTEKIMLRGHMAIKCALHACEVLDLRTNSDPVALIYVSYKSINVSDNYIYMASTNAEIRDLRKPTEPVWSSLPLGMQYGRMSVPLIDLVSMNLWCATGQVWDLAHYKWSMESNLYLPYSFENTLCNGKHAITYSNGKIFKRDLAGESYFPFSS